MHRSANCVNIPRRPLPTEMRGRLLRYVVCFLYLFIGGNAYRTSHHSQNLLNRLLGAHSSKPLVVFLNLGATPRSSDFDELFNTEDDDGLIEDNESYRTETQRSESSSDYENRHIFHHLLRELIFQKPEEDISSRSSSSKDSSEQTKQALRFALRVRCQKVDWCIMKCPPKKPSCPTNCQQVFDNLNLCPPPDPCANKPRCGRTMPPRWRI